MKRIKPLFTRILLFGIIMIVNASCDKKSSNNDPAPSSSYRISEINFYEDDTLMQKSVVSYNGNQITEILGYMGNTKTPTLYYKENLEYAAGKINKMIVYMMENNVWRNYSQLEVKSFSGSKPAEVIYTYYDTTGTVTWQYKYIYVFSNDRISETTFYLFENGAWISSGKKVYNYNDTGQLITQQEYDSDGFPAYKSAFTWVGGVVAEKIRIRPDGTTSSKYVYEYSNSLTSKESYYYWKNNNWDLQEYTMFLYNSNNCISEERSVGASNSHTSNAVYTYQSGTGNYRELACVFGEYNFWPGDPQPLPTKSASGDKSIPGKLFPSFIVH